MLSSDVTKRRNVLISSLISQWRHWSSVASMEPGVPYEDDDAGAGDRETAIAQALRRLIGVLEKLDYSSCIKPDDVNRHAADRVRAELTRDPRPGLQDACRIALAQLRIPADISDAEDSTLEDADQ